MTRRTAALAAAVALVATPALAQQSSQSPSQSSQSQSSGGAQVVEQQDLQKYVQALQQMAQHEPGIQTALEQGQPVDPSLLDKVPQKEAREAIEKSGLGPAQFRYITGQIETNPQAQQQFKQVARQAAQQSGGQSGSSMSGGQSGQSSGSPSQTSK